MQPLLARSMQKPASFNSRLLAKSKPLPMKGREESLSDGFKAQGMHRRLGVYNRSLSLSPNSPSGL